MSRYGFLTLMSALLLAAIPARAQSAGYFLERLQIQANAFLLTLDPVGGPSPEPGSTVAQQLEQSTSNSVWSRQMVTDDVRKIVETSRELDSQLSQATPEELLAARSTLESLARRLRVSSSALTLSPQSRTQLDFLMLELDESANQMEAARDQMLAQQRAGRARRRVSIGVGVGVGYGPGYGTWGVPWGWGSYSPYGNIYGPGPYYYSGYPGGYGFGPRGCRY